MKPVEMAVAFEVAAQVAVTLLRPTVVAVAVVGFSSGSLAAQKSTGPAAGTLVVDGGGATVRENGRRASGADRRVRNRPFLDSVRGRKRHPEP